MATKGTYKYCIICCDNKQEGLIRLACGCKINYHKSCISAWAEISDACPTCRKKIEYRTGIENVRTINKTKLIKRNEIKNKILALSKERRSIENCTYLHRIYLSSEKNKFFENRDDMIIKLSMEEAILRRELCNLMKVV